MVVVFFHAGISKHQIFQTGVNPQELYHT